MMLFGVRYDAFAMCTLAVARVCGRRFNFCLLVCVELVTIVSLPLFLLVVVLLLLSNVTLDKVEFFPTLTLT